ncbi:protein DedA (plasmid) [Comamonadaceae bacterium OS-4]|nr:protein DedA [Comamonadaceae bacterium OS-4]
MFSVGMLTWLSSDQGLMLMLSNNWLLGVALVSAVIFCETGLVVLPFLPGDSLLFATGAFLGVSGISPASAIAMITIAAIAGDGLNFMIGRSRFGQILLTRGWIKPHHLAKTRDYFDRYGGPTVTVGRFVPIVRTVAPFMAGLSGMNARRFAIYNIMGAIVWCSVLILAGVWLGKVPWVKDHLSWVSIGIVLMSILPVLGHMLAKPRPIEI